ncbi:MAG: PTS sugar transporter [Firmicutes bacterium]|nr:PTS sugar transporter [Candidatus Fermentithermobacillaceae bacterium]
MARRIALIGSSGGNLYNMGGKDPVNLIDEVVRQASAAQIEVSDVLFIAAKASMDQVKPDTPAAIYVLEDGTPKVAFEGPLEQVNEKAKEMDADIAKKISAGEIDGLFLVSCDPDGVNRESLKAAAEQHLVVVGTGGTSMAKAQSMGITVISVSGTTGTTNRTRAIAGISALAKHWGLKYRPVIGKASAPGAASGSPWQRVNFRGIMMASLPGFIAMALTLAIGKIPGLGVFSTIFDTMIAALPVIVAAVAAKQVSGMDEVAIVAGVVAGTLSAKGGIIGGIIGGVLAGILVPYLLTLSLNWRFPATTANIVAGGISGLASGLVVYFLIAPLALWAGNGIRTLIDTLVGLNSVLAGAVAGLLIWPAIMGGVYHAAILPIVLLEMEKTGSSFLGAIDMTGLVMVSAGITLANVLYPRTKDEATVALPGFMVNVGFGTFVEAAYPFMFSDRLVFGGALLSAALSGAFVGAFNVRGTAYVPSIVAPAMSNNPIGFLVSMLVAMGSAFLLTLAANKRARMRQRS